MWIRCNPNPAKKEVPDCVVRAIAIALREEWSKVHWDLCVLSAREYNMPSADAVWGKYLRLRGFEQFLLPESCPECVTVSEFCRMYPGGVYIIGTGSHAVAVVNGDYYDSWDSGSEIPSYFWRVR